MIKLLCIEDAKDTLSEENENYPMLISDKVYKGTYYYTLDDYLDVKMWVRIYEKEDEFSFINYFYKEYFMSIHELRERVINKILEK